MSKPLTVAVDTCVLFLLDNVGRLDLLGKLQGVEFVFPGEVWEEVKREGQRKRILQAVRQGWVRRLPLDLAEEQVHLQKARLQGLGMGEAACFAMAVSRGFALASDDEAALKKGESHLGPGRVLTTPGLVVLAIHQGLLEIEEADGFLPQWERFRFKVSFRSFREKL